MHKIAVFYFLEVDTLKSSPHDSESQETLKNSKIDKCKMLTLNAYPSSKMKWVTVLLIPFGTSSLRVPSRFESYVGHSRKQVNSQFLSVV